MSVLSRVYGRVALYRRAWYELYPHRRRRLTQPVISVGNLVVGGSGKTPVVAALARLLLEEGARPAILSRGYGRLQAADGVVVVSNGGQVLVDTAHSGDEPQMLARALPGVPVLVASDRYLAGMLAQRRFGCTVHLLDDGFQHVQLERNVDLLVMSGGDLDERVLPSGRLREPLDAASRADAVIVSGSEADAAAIRERVRPGAVFHVATHYEAPKLLDPFGASLLAAGAGRAVAVAAIARPDRFFGALNASGWDVVREITFRDHHWFTARDIDRIHAAARETNADVIVTTEKDAMRLLGRMSGAGLDGPPTWAFLPMDVTIEPAAAFSSWLRERLAA